MIPQKVTELINQGENSAIEFKTGDVRPEILAREMVAFANHFDFISFASLN